MVWQRLRKTLHARGQDRKRLVGPQKELKLVCTRQQSENWHDADRSASPQTNTDAPWCLLIGYFGFHSSG